ncbi:acyl-CoA dehydrogenase family protein [Actinokineospora bangkokensis]|uniref:Acyl-CoA dehydrogenase n=1 Tax=Actinokineospora bangkokensis TaxID=1193682 RepID=A0A1Q9LNW9_9PSEU|nr:acyl-CoA dehydrogenase family protein [Actinokineospora bangkokensis]OLR93703.1 acyl-CoA dehydrogenase [Actinokineospora bangkokensis]
MTPFDPVLDALDAHHPVRARVRAALAELVLPHADEWERARRIPEQGWRALGDAGLLGMPLSGDGFTDSAILLEELGRTGYAGIRAGVAVHAFMAAHYLDRFGTPEQRAELLADVRAGTRVAALALSEPDAGTDLAAITTRAEPDGSGGYRLTGHKAHVANGSQAGFYVCLARLRTVAARPRSLAGCGFLLVDADAPGVRATPEPMLGWHSADVCEVTFDAVPVPADRVLGNPARTLTYLVESLDFERLAAGLLAAGGAAHCLDLLDGFVRGHHVGGAPLSANQVVRHTTADLAAELDLVRSYAHLAALRHARGRLDTRTASTLKLRATELAANAARACLQYHGARGYREGSAVARVHRDAAAGTITAGANELLRDLVFDTAAPS